MATATRDLDVLDPLTLDGDALDPIGGGGALVGYGRVSTTGQNLDRQIHALTGAGCQKVFTDKKSGRTPNARNSGSAWSTSDPATPWWCLRWIGSADPCKT
jgi:hypothetical protein